MLLRGHSLMGPNIVWQCLWHKLSLLLPALKIWRLDKYFKSIFNRVNKLGLSCAKLSSNWAQLSQVRMERGDFKNKLKLGIPETWTIDICWNMVCPVSQCDNCPCKTPVNLCTACLVEPPKKKSFSWFLVRVAELNIQVSGCLAGWLINQNLPSAVPFLATH